MKPNFDSIYHYLYIWRGRYPDRTGQTRHMFFVRGQDITAGITLIHVLLYISLGTIVPGNAGRPPQPHINAICIQGCLVIFSLLCFVFQKVFKSPPLDDTILLTLIAITTLVPIKYAALYGILLPFSCCALMMLFTFTGYRLSTIIVTASVEIVVMSITAAVSNNADQPDQTQILIPLGSLCLCSGLCIYSYMVHFGRELTVSRETPMRHLNLFPYLEYVQHNALQHAIPAWPKDAQSSALARWTENKIYIRGARPEDRRREEGTKQNAGIIAKDLSHIVSSLPDADEESEPPCSEGLQAIIPRPRKSRGMLKVLRRKHLNDDMGNENAEDVAMGIFSFAGGARTVRKCIKLDREHRTIPRGERFAFDRLYTVDTATGGSGMFDRRCRNTGVSAPVSYAEHVFAGGSWLNGKKRYTYDTGNLPGPINLPIVNKEYGPAAGGYDFFGSNDLKNKDHDFADTSVRKRSRVYPAPNYEDCSTQTELGAPASGQRSSKSYHRPSMKAATSRSSVGTPVVTKTCSFSLTLDSIPREEEEPPYLSDSGSSCCHVLDKAALERRDDERAIAALFPLKVNVPRHDKSSHRISNWEETKGMNAPPPAPQIQTSAPRGRSCGMSSPAKQGMDVISELIRGGYGTSKTTSANLNEVSPSSAARGEDSTKAESLGSPNSQRRSTSQSHRPVSSRRPRSLTKTSSPKLSSRTRRRGPPDWVSHPSIGLIDCFPSEAELQHLDHTLDGISGRTSSAFLSRVSIKSLLSRTPGLGKQVRHLNNRLSKTNVIRSEMSQLSGTSDSDFFSGDDELDTDGTPSTNRCQGPTPTVWTRGRYVGNLRESDGGSASQWRSNRVCKCLAKWIYNPHVNFLRYLACIEMLMLRSIQQKKVLMPSLAPLTYFKDYKVERWYLSWVSIWDGHYHKSCAKVHALAIVFLALLGVLTALGPLVITRNYDHMMEPRFASVLIVRYGVITALLLIIPLSMNRIRIRPGSGSNVIKLLGLLLGLLSVGLSIFDMTMVTELTHKYRETNRDMTSLSQELFYYLPCVVTAPMVAFFIMDRCSLLAVVYSFWGICLNSFHWTAHNGRNEGLRLNMAFIIACLVSYIFICRATEILRRRMFCRSLLPYLLFLDDLLTDNEPHKSGYEPQGFDLDFFSEEV